MSSYFDIVSIDIKEKDKWTDAISKVTVSVYLTWDYCNFLSGKYNGKIKLLKISNLSSGMLVCYSTRSKKEGFDDVYSIYGIGGMEIWGEEKEKLFQSLDDYFFHHNVITYFFMLHPKDFSLNDVRVQKYRTIYSLDLKESLDTLWKNINSNHKYEINKILKSVDYNIVSDKKEIIEGFKKLYNQTLNRVKASDVYFFDENSIDMLFESNISEVLAISFKNEIQCVIVFLKYGEWSEYYINASSDEGRIASRFLIWEMIKKMKESNVQYVNLGGGVVDGDTLDDFKRRFGGIKKDIGICKRIVNELEYNRLCDQYNVDLSENYFPSYWKK